MLKRTLLAAFAVTTAVSATAQMGMMDVDAKTSKSKELMSFLDKDAYKKLDAADAYVLTEFVGDLPGNYQTALLRGLVGNAQEARMSKMRNQDASNAMAPTGDMMSDREILQTMKPMWPNNYDDSIKMLETGQDETDRGLIDSLFLPKSYTVDPLMSPCNERALDAVVKYLQANAKSTVPYRLKYTSLSSHMYAGLPGDWNGHPWPAGS